MWYVMQVRSGTEESIRQQCKMKIPGQVLEDCFIPMGEVQRKYHGEWHMMLKPLFPGYLFMITDQLDELRIRLQKVDGLTKLLGSGDEIVPLTEEEVMFLLRFGGEEQIVRISKGILEGSQVRVVSGPLLGMEGSIQKINYHKRIAILKTHMFGREQEIKIGLEVVIPKS